MEYIKSVERAMNKFYMRGRRQPLILLNLELAFNAKELSCRSVLNIWGKADITGIENTF